MKEAQAIFIDALDHARRIVPLFMAIAFDMRESARGREAAGLFVVIGVPKNGLLNK